jgi:hypothetical protein
MASSPDAPWAGMVPQRGGPRWGRNPVARIRPGHDLFEVARVDRHSRRPNSSEPSASLDEWDRCQRDSPKAVLERYYLTDSLAVPKLSK